jgi:hypothetical protein
MVQVASEDSGKNQKLDSVTNNSIAGSHTLSNLGLETGSVIPNKNIAVPQHHRDSISCLHYNL